MVPQVQGSAAATAPLGESWLLRALKQVVVKYLHGVALLYEDESLLDYSPNRAIVAQFNNVENNVCRLRSTIVAVTRFPTAVATRLVE